jgi:cyclopropane fatty-acyl-phospholipid synthase-like methyltransferase
MNRADWLIKIRKESEQCYDKVWAPLYGEKWGLYSNATHLRFLSKFVSLLPSQARVLDAACGAGRYFPILLEVGVNLLGTDQSQGMLLSARSRFPQVPLEKVSLQELPYQQAFEGLICIDAMEHISPEDWLEVLSNFHLALIGGGFLYFTVEIADTHEIRQAFEQARLAGLPVVLGELVDGDVYHYYPTLDRVLDWLQATGFALLEEGQGDGYYHFLCQSHPPSS